MSGSLHSTRWRGGTTPMETSPAAATATTAGRLVLRPTLPGLIWLMAVLALLATAINYGNNLVFALAFLLAALWLHAARDCRRNLIGIDWQGLTPRPAFAGDTLDAGGRLASPQDRVRPGLVLHAGPRTSPLFDLPAAGDALPRLAVPALRRGPQTIDALQLTTRWPLGLWQARRALPPLTALVYPAPAGDQPLPGATPNPAHRAQASDDFQGLRTYRPGDAPRRVNWRTWARRDELLVNVFDGDRGGDTLWLDWQHTRGDTEARLAQLARWLIDADAAGRDTGLRLPGDTVPAGRGTAHRERCLRALALHSPPSSETAA